MLLKEDNGHPEVDPAKTGRPADASHVGRDCPTQRSARGRFRGVNLGDSHASGLGNSYSQMARWMLSHSPGVLEVGRATRGGFTKPEGVVFVGRAQGRTPVSRTEKRRQILTSEPLLGGQSLVLSLIN